MSEPATPSPLARPASGRADVLQRLSACILLALTLSTGGALADHSSDHQASRAASSGAFDALNMLQRLDGGGGTDEFLPPDVAYVMSGEPRDDSTLVVRFDFADAYYLYRDKFSFAVSDSPGASFRSIHLPEGEVKDDPYFGRMEVYYQSVEALLEMQRSTSELVALSLRVGYQGCAEAGLCYPPMEKAVAITLPAGMSQGAGPAIGAGAPADAEPRLAAAGELPEQDRIAHSLASGGTALFAMSMGMGVPLLVAGTSGGKLLPSTGPRMAKIKVLFGIMLLGVAVYLLERLFPEGVGMFLWGMLLGAAIYFGALDSLAPQSGGWRRLGKAFALVVGIYGVLILVGAAAGGNDVWRPLRNVSLLAGGEIAERKLAFERIKGVAGLHSELRLAATA